MVNEKHPRTTVHPSNWKAGDLSKEKITIDLSATQLDVFDHIVTRLRSGDLTLDALTGHNSPMEDVASDFYAIANEVLYGRGIVVIRGWPIGSYSAEEISNLFIAWGSLIGEPVVQNGRGDRLVHVRDVQIAERVSTSNREVMLHSDLEAIVCLLALQKAKSGGTSTIASARAVYDRIAQTRPDLLTPLNEGYRFFWRGDANEQPIQTDYAIPVFSEDASHLNVFMQRGLQNTESAIAQEALEYFIEIARSPDLTFSFTLEPGEASVMCNYSVLHARDAFEDWPEPERRRHLLRLWLSVPDEKRPIHPNLRRLYQDAFWYAAQPKAVRA